MRTSSSRAIRRAALLLAAAALPLLFSACSDDANKQNAITPPVIPPGLVVHDTTVFATGDSTFITRAPMHGSRNLVGAGSGYRAFSLLRVYPTDFPQSDTISIQSASLEVLMNYHLGPPGATVAFTVHRLLKEWDPSTFTWDSLTTDLYDPSDIRGTWSGVISADTQTVKIPLDTVMVREWTSTSTTANRYGIILVPASGSTGVAGFYSSQADSASYRPFIRYQERWPSGVVLDTGYAVYFDTFVGDTPLGTDPKVVTTQAGVTIRSSLLFDVSFLKEGMTVNSAQLQLHRLGSPAFLTTRIDSSLSVHLLASTDRTIFEVAGYPIAPSSGTSPTLTGDVRHLVQSWAIGTNYGLVLRSSSGAEYDSFDQSLIAGTRATDPALRPRLRIVYSTASLEKTK